MPEAATPDDPAAVLLKEFEALQEDLSSLRRKHGGALPDNRGGGGAIRQRTTGVFGGGAARYSPW